MTQNIKFGPESFAAGTVIVHQGDSPDKFYIITSGHADVFYCPPDGEDTLINQMGPGEYFGEIGLLKSSRRVATVRARTDMTVMSMDHATFGKWMQNSALSREEIDETVEQRISNVGALEYVNQPSETTTPPDPDSQSDDNRVKEIVAEQLAQHEWESGVQQFTAGTVIAQQGEIADKFYIIVDGVVEITRREENGNEHFVARLNNGHYFGEIGLMEGRQRSATVTAKTAVKVVAFDRETFGKWMSNSPLSQDEILHTAQERIQINKEHAALHKSTTTEPEED